MMPVRTVKKTKQSIKFALFEKAIASLKQSRRYLIELIHFLYLIPNLETDTNSINSDYTLQLNNTC